MGNILLNLRDLLFNEKYKRIIRFGIVGVLNTGVSFAVYSLCVGYFDLHHISSYTIGYSVGILNSFVFNKLWTFESKGINKKTTAELIQFVVINLISLGISLRGLDMLIRDLGVNKYLAQIGTTFIAQVVNYLGYKLWVFKK